TEIQRMEFVDYVRSLNLMNDDLNQMAHRLSAECKLDVSGFSNQEVLEWTPSSSDYFGYGDTLDEAMRVVCPQGEYDANNAMNILHAAALRREVYKVVLKPMADRQF